MKKIIHNINGYYDLFIFIYSQTEDPVISILKEIRPNYFLNPLPDRLLKCAADLVQITKYQTTDTMTGCI